MQDGRHNHCDDAARAILVRSAPFSPMSAARTLAGGPVATRDVYWAGEGARLAQCALALALLLVTKRHWLYGTSTDWPLNQAAVSILLNNTGNKLFFRSSVCLGSVP